MKKFVLAAFLVVSLGLPASADLKVALVDTTKAFDAFHKTQEMAVRIAAKKASCEKEIRDLEDEYESSRQEAQGLANAVKDTSIMPSVRHSKGVAFSEKVQDLEALEKEIEQVRESRSQEIQDDLLRSHQEINEEMEEVITAYVSARGYDLVLDKSLVGEIELPLYPFNSTKIVDLTSVIIAKLNAKAPLASSH